MGTIIGGVYMKKFVLFSLLQLVILTATGCTLEVNNISDNPTSSVEDTTTVKEGIIKLEDKLVEDMESVETTGLFALKVECDKDWSDVYSDFVLTNDVEDCLQNQKIIIITKKQIENLVPADGYDIVLKYSNKSGDIVLTDEKVDRLDKTEWYRVEVIYEGSSQYEEYCDEVNGILEEYDIDKSMLEHCALGNFKVKLYPDEIKELMDDPRISEIKRYIVRLLVDF